MITSTHQLDDATAFTEMTNMKIFHYQKIYNPQLTEFINDGILIEANSNFHT